jgi:hypothetical protein
MRLRNQGFPLIRERTRHHLSLELADLGCYIIVMMTGRGWMLRIMGPILG